MSDQRAAGGIPLGGLPDITQDIVVRFRYPVRFTRGLLDPANTLLRDATGAAGRARLLVVVDDGVVAARPAIADEVTDYCRAHGDRLELAGRPIIVAGGERVKNDRAAVDQVRAAIDVYGIDRHAFVVAIGGGAVLDAIGYAAATAHRGVRLIRVPSTVLAQNDSAVGVKNGINGFGKKNFVGTFAPPHAVLNDLELLTTLSERDWRAGISEAIKVALLRSEEFFCWIEGSAAALEARSLEAMAWLVHRCAALHLAHIATSGDPFELGSARPLDFGHWAAHKLEQLTDHELRHGEAVGIGLALDSTYAYLSGALPESDWRRILAVLEACGLACWHPAMAVRGRGSWPAVMDGLEEFRQHLGGELTITLVAGIGSPYEVHEIDADLMVEAAQLLRDLANVGGEPSWEHPQAQAR